MALTKDQILSCDDIPKKEVQVKEWGGSVYVRMLTASEKDRMEGHLKDHKYNNVRAYVAAMSICDENGKSLFSIEDIEALGKKSASALDRVFDATIKLNTFTVEDVEELEKKSEKTPS